MAGIISTRRAAIAAVTGLGLLVPAIGPVQAQRAATTAKDSPGVLIWPSVPDSSLWVRSLDPAQTEDGTSHAGHGPALTVDLVKLDVKEPCASPIWRGRALPTYFRRPPHLYLQVAAEHQVLRRHPGRRLRLRL